MVFDIFLLLLVFNWFNNKGEKSRAIERLKEEIDDFRGWDEKEAMYRLVGSIKRLNKNNIYEYDLYDCYLNSSKLFQIIFYNSNFTTANLDNCQWGHCIIDNCDFTGANMNNIKFRGTKILKGKFHKNKINNIDYYDSEITEAFFYELNITNGGFYSSSLIDVTFWSVNIQYVEFKDVHFIGVDFKSTIFRKCKFNNCQFSHCKIDTEENINALTDDNEFYSAKVFTEEIQKSGPKKNRFGDTFIEFSWDFLASYSRSLDQGIGNG